MSFERETEIREAVLAGDKALQSLREAQKYLNSAGNWGLMDILGGKLISNIAKHSNLRKSNACLEAAKRDLQRFQSELKDVDGYLPDIDFSGFLTFADFFFDGALADIMVQSKIGKAKKQVNEAINMVSDIVRRLRNELK